MQASVGGHDGGLDDVRPSGGRQPCESRKALHDTTSFGATARSAPQSTTANGELLASHAGVIFRHSCRDLQTCTKLELEQRLVTRMSIAVALDRCFRQQHPMTLWGIAVIIGVVVIWGSSLVGIFFSYAPQVNENGVPIDPGHDCAGHGKEVGLLTSLNWTVVYLFLFPFYLVFMSTLAKTVRRTIDEFIDRGVLGRVDGQQPTKPAVHALLDQDLQSTQPMFLTLIVGIAFVALGGWWTSVGQPLLYFEIGGQIVDWSTTVIQCGQRSRQWPVFAYSLAAYIWMGAALFAYLSCLFMGFNYASFLQKLAHVNNDPNSGAIDYKIFFDRPILKKFFSRIVATYCLACVFGLMAAFFMRFQSQYLYSEHLNISEYFFDSLNDFVSAMLGSNPSQSTRQVRFQASDAANQTLGTGVFVLIVTTVALFGTIWCVFNAFNSAKDHTGEIESRLQSASGGTLAPSDADEMTTGFLPTVLPYWPLWIVVVAAIAVASFWTRYSLFLAGVAAVTLPALALIQEYLRRRDEERAKEVRSRLVPDAVADRLQKIVSEKSRFSNLAEFIQGLERMRDTVCVVETPQGGGTGFLVSPNLVLTNYHVIKDMEKGNASPGDIKCRFDYLTPPSLSETKPGRKVSLVAGDGWLVMHRNYSKADLSESGGQWHPEELDYALLMLDERIGELPGPSGPRARGWFRLQSLPAPMQKDDVILIGQHPRNLTVAPAVQFLPMQLAIGDVLGFVGAGLRMRHDTRTLPGSSGSPCCNADLELVALHHAGDPKDWGSYKGQYNQAIPISLIVADLMKQTKIWKAHFEADDPAATPVG